MAKRITTENAPQESKISMVVFAFFLVIVVVGICGIVVYYNRRVTDLETEVARVHYIADPGVNDPNHFDNPVYSMKGHEDNSSLLNNQVHNDLGPFKSSNLDKDGAQCYGYGSTLLKNREADANNPNVYHSIEDLKLEHVYDEIKGKETAEQEYDHLDYSRPGTSWKPHYQRMANGMIKKPEQPEEPKREDDAN